MLTDLQPLHCQPAMVARGTYKMYQPLGWLKEIFYFDQGVG
jgi:hypothetical protein